MGSYLRNLLFRLLSALDTLRHLQEVSLLGVVQLSESEKSRIGDVIAFLKQIIQDTRRYAEAQRIPDEEMGEVFTDFLTVLLLTQDQRLAQGPAYAVQHVALDNRWSRTIRTFDDEQERKTIQQLSDWITILNACLEEGSVSQSVSDSLAKIVHRFERTVDQIERSM